MISVTCFRTITVAALVLCFVVIDECSTKSLPPVNRKKVFSNAQQHEQQSRLKVSIFREHVQQDPQQQRHFINKRNTHDLQQKPQSKQQQKHFIVKRHAQPDPRPRPKGGGDSQKPTGDVGHASLEIRHNLKVGTVGIVVTAIALVGVFCVVIYLIISYWRPILCK